MQTTPGHSGSTDMQITPEFTMLYHNNDSWPPPWFRLDTTRGVSATSLLPCMTGCCQKQRRCRIEPCCRWTCQDSWWRCFPHRFFSVTDHAATTWCAQAAPWSHQSSWCPVHARLREGTRERGLGYIIAWGLLGKPHVRKLDLQVSPHAISK